MKQIFVVRHAKASWMEDVTQDQQRPLDPEGVTNALKAGKLLAQEDLFPELILSSTAVRAKQTASLIADGLELPGFMVECKNALYNASAETILEVLKSIATDEKTIMIVAHNPGISNFLSLLTDGSSVNMGPCDIGILELDIDSWEDCLPGKAVLSRYIESY